MFASRWSHTLIVMMGDAVVFFSALYLALVLRNLSLPSSAVYIEHVQAFFYLFVVYELILYIAGFWGKHIIPTAKNIFELLIPAHLTATVVMLGYFYMLPSVGISPKTNLLIFASVLCAGMYAWKLFGLRLFTLYPIRAVTVGPMADLLNAFEEQPLWNIKVVAEFNRQHGIQTIEKSIKERRADVIIVDLDRYPRIDMLYKMMFSDISIVDAVTIREEMTSKVDLDRVDSAWFVSHVTRKGGAYKFFKRLIDVCAGMLIGCVFVVMYPLVWIAIKLEDGKHVLLRNQTRTGQQGREFRCFKFRTMVYDEVRWKNKGDKKNYVTKVGAVLRKSRLDEFAQCINLIRGDISLVGPRPILLNEHKTIAKRNPYQQARLLVQPGLTGHAQVTQLHAPENEAEALERLSYDLYYIKNVSFWLDLKIILKTVRKLAQKTGMK